MAHPVLRRPRTLQPDAFARGTQAARFPLSVLMLAIGVAAHAQVGAPGSDGAASSGAALRPVTVTADAEAPEGKDSVRATSSGIGKGNQQLRDIPQSVTVVTEKLIDDRNLDTVRDVLKNTAGVTFQAAEGGEEDIRLRGFSLATTGDIFIDGMRDPGFYDRDTFAFDRVELLRGSASMLFGRGSTGGAVNQVTKVPRLVDEHEVLTTLGSHNHRRVTGDFNFQTGEDQALRLNVMKTRADNNGSGALIDKQGLSLGYRLGIGTANEFLVQAFYLDNDNGVNYGLPWIRPTAGSTGSALGIIPGLKPDAYYGVASDASAGGAKTLTFSHIHRFNSDVELKTQLRQGVFERDLRASTIRFANPTSLANLGPSTVLSRGSIIKYQDVDTLHAQSDLSAKFDWAGMRHELLTGLDYGREEKRVYAARTAAQGGVTVPAKPTTTIGTPGAFAAVDEGARVFRDGNDFSSRALGIYAQDLLQIAPAWKLLVGIRYDKMEGTYNAYGIPAAAAGPVTTTTYRQSISEWSKRVGVLFQPNALHSYHLSYGTSFNTSGDTYSYNAQSANTPPESSENIELGAKLDTADRRFTTRLALFRSTKTNERNTDPDTAATRLLLSGKRHAAGFEVDLTGRITPAWEVYGSYMWLPVAKVDVAASTATTVGNRVGDRPGLSPKHSGTVWSTYQVLPQLRLGAGVNFRAKQSPADVTAPAWQAPGFATLDLMAEYSFNEAVKLRANLINAADKYYADSLYRGHYVPGAGRLAQLTLAAKF